MVIVQGLSSLYFVSIFCYIHDLFLFVDCAFQAPELHLEIHKHGYAQPASGAAEPSTSSSTKVLLLKNDKHLELLFDFYFYNGIKEGFSIAMFYECMLCISLACQERGAFILLYFPCFQIGSIIFKKLSTILKQSQNNAW